MNIVDLPNDVLRTILTDDMLGTDGITVVFFTCRKLRSMLTSKITSKTDFCNVAAHGGSQAVLTWAREMDCPLRAETMAWAAYNGDIKMMEWLRGQNCPYDYLAFAFSMRRNKDTSVFDWLLKMEYPLTGKAMTMAMSTWNVPAIDWLERNSETTPDSLTEAFLTAIRYDHIECVDWFHARGVPATAGCVFVAAKFRRYNIIKKILTSNRDTLCSFVCVYAAKHGDLDFLEWLLEFGIIWDDNIYYAALANDHANIVDWAIKNGCPQRPGCYFRCIEKDRLDIAKQLYDRNFPLSTDLFREAVIDDRLDFVKWLGDVGCPRSPDLMDTALIGEFRPQLLSCLLSIGCHLDYKRFFAAMWMYADRDLMTWVFEHSDFAITPVEDILEDIQRHARADSSENVVNQVRAALTGDLLALIAIPFPELDYTKIVECAAEQGHLHIIYWLEARLNGAELIDITEHYHSVNRID